MDLACAHVPSSTRSVVSPVEDGVMEDSSIAVYREERQSECV